MPGDVDDHLIAEFLCLLGSTQEKLGCAIVLAGSCGPAA
jgi:hypothetical protein